MKTLIIFLFVLITISCNNKSNSTIPSESNQLAIENTELKNKQELRDSASNQLVAAMDEIQANLDSIKNKENIIDLYKNDKDKTVMGKKDIKNKILNDIRTIYHLSKKNKSIINQLNNKLKKEKKKEKDVEKDVEKMVSFLKSQIADKDVEIEKLKNELIKYKIDVTSLTSKLDSIEKVDTKLTEELHTAYFIVGTVSELKQQKVLTKEGGFIGIGRVKTLMNDFNKSGFTKIDITKSTKINFSNELSKIITTHPSKSYAIVNAAPANYIDIKNPDEFWSSSKYLVVIIKK